MTEGNTGTKTASLAVTLSTASGQTVTVNYATANGTATAGSDYVAATGTLTFAPGVTSQTVVVTVNGDATGEPDETVLVNLSGATNASISDSQGILTITNDDPPSLTIDSDSVTEGNFSSVTATFTVSLTSASAQTVTVAYATANGTATAGSDYTAASGTLTFTPGTTTRTINVTVLTDTLDEANETFVVNLSNPVNATIADAQGIGTIVDNDSAPSLSINNVSVTEGNTGTKTASFAVTPRPTSGQTVTVNYATANGTRHRRFGLRGRDRHADVRAWRHLPAGGRDRQRRYLGRVGRDRARQPERRDQRQHRRLSGHTHHHQR